MASSFLFFVGIDWGSQSHQVAVLSPEPRLLESRSFPHSGQGLRSLVDRLAELSGGQPSLVAVSLETPRGPVVDALLDRGFSVFSLNPKQLDRFRDRHTMAGAKDDRRDAYVLADALRTDLKLFRPLRQEDARIVELREFSRMEEELGDELGRLENQLREQVWRYYPQLLTLSPAMDDPWLWSLWELVPAPQIAAQLSVAHLEPLLKKHHIRRVSAAEVLAILKRPALRVAPGVTQAARRHVALLLPRLRLLQEQRKECVKRLNELLEELSEGESEEPADATIVLSCPGIGVRIAAALLAEAGQALSERDYGGLRALCGVAPVTSQTGVQGKRDAKGKCKKRPQVQMRRACAVRLRNAVYLWAQVSLQHDAYSRELYDQQRGRGHSHARALRGLGDRLLGRLIGMLKNRSLYKGQKPAKAEKKAA
jgi:transposase